MAVQSIQIKRLAVKTYRQSAGIKALLGLLCLLFVTAQAIDLTHSHNGDLNLQADCDICLKLGSDDDMLLNAVESAPGSHRQILAVPAHRNVPVADILTSQARAPPLT
ncbi:MAG: hypothetical protein RIC17_05285 [Gammaproteobacteria bacterium]